MDLAKYKVKAIVLSDGEHIHGKSVEILDEGSFSRIDGTYIIDKHKIISINESNNMIEVKMKDKDIILRVQKIAQLRKSIGGTKD